MREVLQSKPSIFIVVLPDDIATASNYLTYFFTVLTQPVDVSIILPQKGGDLIKATLPAECELISYSSAAFKSVESFWCDLFSVVGEFEALSIFIRCGVRLPDCWDLRLRFLSSELIGKSVAALSPMCVKHPMFSVFSDLNSRSLSVDEVDQWLVDYSTGQFFDSPMMLQSCCILLRGSSFWSRLAELHHNDSSLNEELRNSGLVLLSTDQLFIDDSSIEKNFFSIESVPKFRLKCVEDYHPIMPIRHALTELAIRNEKPKSLVSCKPVQLHLAHSWGGGLGRWVEDYIKADNYHNNLVLRPLGTWGAFGQAVALYRDASMSEPLKKWMLAESIPSTAIRHYQYREILDDIVEVYNIERILVSSLIGQSLDVFDLGLPISYVFHDFYPFCPVIVATFDTPCVSCDKQRMGACLVENSHHQFFKEESSASFIGLRTAFLEKISKNSVHLIAPSKSVVDRYHKLAPALLEKSITVIEHGLSDDLIESLFEEDVCDDKVVVHTKLRVVILGSLTEGKGRGLLESMITDLIDTCDILLLGAHEGGEVFEGYPNVRWIYSYTKETLGKHLRDFSPDIGLLLSVVPETFSYTLSEFFASSIPVLATKVGAFEERVTDDNGWLVECDSNEITTKLAILNQDRSEILSRKSFLKNTMHKSASQMVDEYFQNESNPSLLPSKLNLARRSYQNPYNNEPVTKVSSGLHVNEQVPYRQLLVEFLEYSANKVSSSPRLSRISRSLIYRSLRVCIGFFRK